MSTHRQNIHRLIAKKDLHPFIDLFSLQPELADANINFQLN